jgi:hypothetical protein
MAVASRLHARTGRWRSLPSPRFVRVARLRRRLAASERLDRHDLVVTGISRSGTSYLCNLLHHFDNCVALNEPREAIEELRQPETPWGLALFYRETREAILSGEPIENKLRDGEVVQDTALYQARHAYTPAVRGTDFVLAVKNTREFLCRLDDIRLVMPTARVVACVRNPVDTIASWKGSFRHLCEADVRSFLGNPRRPWLPPVKQAALESIASVRAPAERRAMWWRFYAELVVERMSDLVVVDYDETMRNPMPVLDGVLRGYRAGRPGPISPAAPSRRRDLLTSEDLDAIRAICSDTAAKLGVALPEASQHSP